MIKKLVITGTLLINTFALALTPQQKKEQAALIALLETPTRNVQNQSGTYIGTVAKIAANMMIGYGPGVAKPAPQNARLIKVNGPCLPVQDQQTLYKCALCISYKEAETVYKIEKLIYHVDMYTAEDGSVEAAMFSDNVEWKDSTWDHDEPCTSPN